MRRVALAAFLAIAGIVLPAQSGSSSSKPLEIYVIDVEGGKSDLWITPAGQTILIDTATGGDRDLNRILDALAAAKVTKLDYLITTHYHVDHAGNLNEISKRMPIANFVDHGDTTEAPLVAGQREQIPGFWALYPSIYAKGKRISVKPGDKLPITGLDWQIVAGGHQVTKKPLAGAGKTNPFCAGTERRAITADPDDGASVASVVTWGKFRTVDFGDMTWDIEHDLMCPNNPIGTIDLYFVNDHGLPDNSSKEFVHALQPRVAIVQNGIRKGTAPVVMEVIRTSPGFEDLWQLHWNTAAGLEWNSPGAFIANGVDPQEVAALLLAPPPAPRGAAPAQTPAPTPGGAAPVRAGGGGGSNANNHSPAYSVKVLVNADGSYTVTNLRNNFSKTYAPRPH
jgi:beta-lactamase superfamily II metal-dependent hydrolase